MTILEDLYYGNIHPNERYIKRVTKVDQLVKLICKNEDALTATLTEQQKEIFEKFKDFQSELAGTAERDAFRDATRIMMEVMEGLETVEKI